MNIGGRSLLLGNDDEVLHNNMMHTSVESITDNLALARHRYDRRYHDHLVDEKIADGQGANATTAAGTGRVFSYGPTFYVGNMQAFGANVI